MITLYEVTSWGTEIREKQYDRLTEKFAVKHNGRRDVRDALVSRSSRLLKTKEEAIKWKRDQIKTVRYRAEDSLRHAESELAAFNRNYPE